MNCYYYTSTYWGMLIAAHWVAHERKFVCCRGQKSTVYRCFFVSYRQTRLIWLHDNLFLFRCWAANDFSLSRAWANNRLATRNKASVTWVTDNSLWLWFRGWHYAISYFVACEIMPIRRTCLTPSDLAEEERFELSWKRFAMLSRQLLTLSWLLFRQLPSDHLGTPPWYWQFFIKKRPW